MKKIIKKILRFFDNNIGFIEGILLFWILIKMGKNADNDTFYIVLALPIYILYINFKYLFKVIKSKSTVKDIVEQKRTIKIKGMQGGGKTSFMCLMASMTNRPIFSLTPLKIKGEFVNILTPEHLALKKRLPEEAICIVDEMSLIFNNIDDKKSKEEVDIRALEIEIQLIRHLFNGSFWYASVETDRALKTLREKILYSQQALGQTAVKNSWIIGPIINKFSKWKWHGYFRTWKMQTYENIEEDGYIFDLSTDTESSTANKFANLLEIVAYNNKDFEYNDRALRRLYDLLNLEFDNRKWTSLEMSEEDLLRQYEKIVKFLVINRGLKLNRKEEKK